MADSHTLPDYPVPPEETTSTTPVVSILVVSYRTRELTTACLASVARQTRIAHELIVVDNNSGDGSAEAIDALEIRKLLLPLRENLGFAQGNNLAARYARGRYLLLLNPDTLVLDGAVDRLVAFAERRPEAGIWGGRTLFPDGRLNPSSAWRAMSPWNLACRASGLSAIAPGSGLFNSEGYGGWRRDSEREVDIVSGCFLLVTRDLWDRLQGFDPAFFMYGEEADLCLRAKALGARPRITPEAVIVHHGGASEPARQGKLVRLLAAKSLLVRRHWSPLARLLGLGLMALWPLGRHLGYRLLARLTGRDEALRAAEIWGEVWRQRSVWLSGTAERDAVAEAEKLAMGRPAGSTR